jgi:hypothetical protein
VNRPLADFLTGLRALLHFSDRTHTRPVRRLWRRVCSASLGVTWAGCVETRPGDWSVASLVVSARERARERASSGHMGRPVAASAKPSRPGRSRPAYDIGGKWLELLKEVAPAVKRVGVLRDPDITAGIGQWSSI